MEWSTEKTFQLIDRYHAKPVLWDSNNGSYKQPNRREEEWYSLAEIFQTTPGEVKRKINSLLASYRRERNKLQLGAGGDESSKWFAFNKLNFLKDKYTPRKFINMEDEEQFANPDMIKIEEVLFPEHLEEDIDDPKLDGNEKYKYSHKKQHVERHQSDEDAGTPKFFKRIKARPIKDEYDVYGELIAHEIRKLPRREQYRVKHSINNIIYEAHMSVTNAETCNQYTSTSTSSQQVTTSQN